MISWWKFGARDGSDPRSFQNGRRGERVSEMAPVITFLYYLTLLYLIFSEKYQRERQEERRDRNHEIMEDQREFERSRGSDRRTKEYE